MKYFYLIIILSLSSLFGLKAQSYIEDFEDAAYNCDETNLPACWNVNNTAQLSTTSPINGTCSMITNTITPGNGATIDVTGFDATGQSTVTFEYFINNNSSDLTADLFVNKAGGGITNQEAIPIVTGSQQTFTFNFNLGTNTIDLQFVITGAQNGTSTFQFDDLQFNQNVTNAGCIILPIELSNFEGKRVNDFEVELEWTTLTETNNDYFVLERKVGQRGSFNPVKTIAGSGNSTVQKTYTVIDHTTDLDVQYRLKQVDFDNRYTYSNVIQVQNPSAQADIELISTGSELTVYFNQQLQESVNEVLIYNQMGGLESVNQSNQLSPIVVPTNQLSSGIYVLVIQKANGEQFTKKFIVQK